MAVIKKESGSVSIADVFAGIQKKHGENIGAFGWSMGAVDRVPTGLFPLDLALGGGLPRGKVTTIFGPELSNKTNIVLSAIRMHQMLWPDKVCVFISIEGFDAPWARAMGVDVDKLLVVQPSYAEQVVDWAEKFLRSEDCGLVAIDSIAAMMTTQEAEKSAEGFNPGANAIAVSKLCRRTGVALTDAEKEGRYPTLIYINQIRHKIGVMYGSPETTPGGFAPLFQSAIRLRVYGKNEMDNQVSTVLPVLKEVKFTLPKNKCPIIAAEGKFRMVTVAHNGWQVGECDDWNTVSAYAKTLGFLAKKEGSKGGWIMLGEEYHKLDEIEARIRADKLYGNKVRQRIISVLLAQGELVEAAE